jgi:hypothetical protein
VERLEHQELLGDDEGLVVRQHDPAGAQADALGPGADRGEQDRRRPAGDARDGVVLRDPEALVADLLGVDRALDRAGQPLGLGTSGAGARPVEEGELHGRSNPSGRRMLPAAAWRVPGEASRGERSLAQGPW